MCNLSIDLQKFFPCNQLKITNISDNEKLIKINLKSQTQSCICPKCNTISNKYHGTYKRKVQDLPILGKQVLLEINSYEYKCENEDCSNKTISESFDGFISYYSRMTERLSDFLCTLALETSCEGAARIAKSMNIKVSGDTIIKILLKKYDAMQTNTCSSTVGIDDFAFKKRHNYGTIIVDEKTHDPIAILNGRDGSTLSNWLKSNKHIKMVTRDRVSAYAKVIEQDLPGAMQIADRFHIHQNLLQAIKKALNREIPSSIKIENTPQNIDSCSDVNETYKKKIIKISDNFTDAEKVRLNLIHKIQKMNEEGYSISEISRLLGKDRRTIRKYTSGNPNDLCKLIRRRSNPYKNRIINLVESGYIEKQIVDILISEGYRLSISNARHMIRKVVKDNNLNINKYSPVINSIKTSTGARDIKYTYITRNFIFKHIWMGCDISENEKRHIYINYPKIFNLKKCINEFRECPHHGGM